MTNNHVNVDVQTDLETMCVTNILQSIAAVWCDVFQTAVLSGNVVTRASNVFDWN